MFIRKKSHQIIVENFNSDIDKYKEKNEELDNENSKLNLEVERLKKEKKNLEFCLDEAKKSNKDLQRTVDKDRAISYQIKNICIGNSDVKFNKINIGELASRI